MLSWQYALAAAGVLVLAAVTIRAGRLAARPGGHARAWALWGGVAWEAALLFGLYALWQFAGSFTVMGAAAAAADDGHGRHGGAVRPVGVLLERRLRRGRVLGHAVGARRLGADRGRRDHHRVEEPVALASRGLPGGYAARRRGHSQSLLAGRDSRRTAGGPGPGGTADGPWDTFW